MSSNNNYFDAIQAIYGDEDGGSDVDDGLFAVANLNFGIPVPEGGLTAVQPEATSAEAPSKQKKRRVHSCAHDDMEADDFTYVAQGRSVRTDLMQIRW